ncbi:MAG: phosphatidate cytidylyltransferase, partial [Phycisphaeraceae bacterium]
TEGSVAVASVSLFALIYLGTLPGFYLAIRHDHSAWVVAALIVITKSCDVGAYFTGRAIGRHKLVPWLSPGKTWEGLGGGVLLSALLAAVLAWVGNTWFSGPDATVRAYPLWFAAVAGLALGLAGQFGDLTASLFKRDAGVKDSGRSIPGFGGLLDVVDSPLVVAPLAYWLLRLLDVVAGG